jgi:hypothetical protein
MTAQYYSVRGFGMQFHCKVSTFANPYTNVNKTTITFGSRTATCVTFGISNSEPHIALMNFLISDDECFSPGSVIERGDKTYKMTLCALYTVLQLFPDIETFTFTDDSHIYCVKDSTYYKMSLAADYIFKYGQTWYEKKFGARLPEPYYTEYKKQMHLLDAPLAPYDSDALPYLNQYKDIYNASKSPRELIAKIRNHEKGNYCMAVSKWLHQYLMVHDSKAFLYSNLWYILSSTIRDTPPTSYSIDVTENIRGGTRRRRRQRKELIPADRNGCFGYGYEDF